MTTISQRWSQPSFWGRFSQSQGHAGSIPRLSRGEVDLGAVAVSMRDRLYSPLPLSAFPANNDVDER
ncbi:MAG: hypothetical protein ABWZ02_13585 [Nakamurella sp.]